MIPKQYSTKWLTFSEDLLTITKTKVFNIYNKDNVMIGKIKYSPTWRQYVFDDNNLIILSKSCMQDMNELITNLMNERLTPPTRKR